SMGAYASIAIVNRRDDVGLAQMPQADEQRRRYGQRKQDSREAEELSEGKQREDHRQRMKTDAIADEPRDQHIVLEQLAQAEDRQHGEKSGQSMPLQRRRNHAKHQPEPESHVGNEHQQTGEDTDRQRAVEPGDL